LHLRKIAARADTYLSGGVCRNPLARDEHHPMYLAEFLVEAELEPSETVHFGFMGCAPARSGVTSIIAWK